MGKKQYYEYEGKTIRIRFEPQRCIHAAECIKGAPGVFDRYRRPWIEPNQSEADTVARVVMQCPTGALQYERLDGAAAEPGLESATARLIPNGPIYLQGQLQLDRPDGSRMHDNRLALCRCGASDNKPFCDNSHEKTGFSESGRLGDPTMAPIGHETSGEVKITTLENGPVRFEGALEVTGAGEDEPQIGGRGALCRCGVSSNKPYCDGSHVAAGFEAD